MDVEDAAVLAKLFSHLQSYDQISEFLYAFQDLRRPRRAMVLAVGAASFEMYDDKDSDESPEQTEIRVVFGYDAENEADNWWVTWGLLRQRSIRQS